MKKVVIGIDIGGTFTKFGLVDRQGNTYAEGNIRTTDHQDINSYLQYLHNNIEKTRKKEKQEFEVLGIGVGAPNGNYYHGTIEYAPNLDWKGVIPVTELLKKHYDIPIAITNDANAAALGEMMYGGARDMRDFVVITLGTGLGSGLVVNGNVVYGHDGFAGELGHTLAVEGGRQCNCGKKGCLETYVSATGLKRTAFELMAIMIEASELREIHFEELTSEMIYKAARQGDPIAKEAFNYTGKILGRGLADTVAHLSPEAFFLFGGLAKAGDLIFKPAKKHMEKFLLGVFKNKVKIRPSGIQDKNAAVLGASSLIWKDLEDYS